MTIIIIIIIIKLHTIFIIVYTIFNFDNCTRTQKQILQSNVAPILHKILGTKKKSL